MVRKLFIIFLIPFIFISCASKPAVDNKPNPYIEITFDGNDTATIFLTYSGSSWAFINGVELKNAAGELRRYDFKKVDRNAMRRGIWEGAVYTTFNYKADGFSKALPYVDDLRAFIGGADVTARPLAERNIFYFVPVNIIYK